MSYRTVCVQINGRLSIWQYARRNGGLTSTSQPCGSLFCPLESVSIRLTRNSIYHESKLRQRNVLCSILSMKIDGFDYQLIILSLSMILCHNLMTFSTFCDVQLACIARFYLCAVGFHNQSPPSSIAFSIFAQAIVVHVTIHWDHLRSNVQ